ncbi:CinA family nicotinamide mononucleotide deamidase-related protein, partial [Desulfovibrio sp. OttesenSCG-928-C14]|nr:CinA family nicotinamide mononucleotide deamidase-related protein [Desulfovibrio sp. OttesenSCG-928-C14]
LCVGTELLLGDTVNTNAAYLARELAGLGILCYHQTVVGDNPERLGACLRQALERSDLVITTGGLGPTYDDLTKETVAAAFGRGLYLHEPSLERIKEFFARVGSRMTENNIKQAMMPEGAVVFANDRGTAPGLALEGGGKIAVMLPGPPREMAAMFEQSARPYLAGFSSEVLVSRSIHFFGIGESRLESELREYMESHSNPTVAPYAKEGEVLLRVTAWAGDEAAARALIAPVVDELAGRFAEYVYGVDVGSLENALTRELRGRGLTLAVAEAASAGEVSWRLAGVESGRDFLRCGVLAFTDEAALNLLGGAGMEAEAKAGAGRELVSEEGVLALAEAVRKKSGADLGCAVGAVFEGPDESADERGGGQGGAAKGAATPASGAGGKIEKSLWLAVSGRGLARTLRMNLTFASIMHYERRFISSRALHFALQCVKGANSL